MNASENLSGFSVSGIYSTRRLWKRSVGNVNKWKWNTTKQC
jgi:hypothetical protein